MSATRIGAGVMQVDVYADVVCPWCYVGERRLGSALKRRPDLDVELSWRPFQLRPEMPAEGLPWREFALEKFGGAENMSRAFDHVVAAGEPDGIRFDFDRVASAPNTVDAHRLILFAQGHGLAWPVAEALFAAYFAGGADLNDRDQLANVAAGAGLDAGDVRGYLSGGDGTAEVWAGQQEAAGLGITGVPFYVFDGRYALSGAQPVGVFANALEAVSAGRAS